VDGAYVLEAPTTLPPGAIPANAHVSSVLSFMATVRSAYPGPVAIECNTHPTTLVQAGSGVTQVEADPHRAGPTLVHYAAQLGISFGMSCARLQ